MSYRQNTNDARGTRAVEGQCEPIDKVGKAFQQGRDICGILAGNVNGGCGYDGREDRET